MQVHIYMYNIVSSYTYYLMVHGMPLMANFFVFGK